MVPPRILWFALVIILAGVTTEYDGRAFGQQISGSAREEQQAAKFQRLWQRSVKSLDPEDRLAALGAAVEMEPALKHWPLQIPRERARGELRARLGQAYWARSQGDRAENQELAIKAYEAALTFFNREAFPREWATAQNELGIAYSERIRGERAENQEFAIKAYEAALNVFTREAFPQEWAKTQVNLGTDYSNRTRGDHAENLELAIKSLEAALTVLTREALPEEWAMTQNNLGNAYSGPHPRRPS